MLKHRHSTFSGEIRQNIPLLHFEMLAKWDIPIGYGIDCSHVARKVASSSPAMRGLHMSKYVGARVFS